MYDFLVAHQLNIMLGMGYMCAITAFFASFSKTLGKRRKADIVGMEVSAAVLLFADRFAYIYRGNTTTLGFYMVRISNYLVFALTLFLLFLFNRYLEDLCVHEGGLTSVPKRLYFDDAVALLGEILVIISQFTGIYYTFDPTNHYIRSSGYFVSYIIAMIFPFVQFTVILKCYFRLNRGVRFCLLLFSVLPFAASLAQIFFYGISLINMTLTGMTIVLYVFVLVDMNNTVENAHRREIDVLTKEHESMIRLFDQTANAFVMAVEKRDAFSQGHSAKVAETARKIAKRSGKSEEKCEEIYYTALLYDIGVVGIPDTLIEKSDELTEEEHEKLMEKPVIAGEILSSITEYPHISQAARYIYERYDGTGYPDHLKGKDIPEVARIVTVADAYVSMTSRQRFRGALPMTTVREEFIKGAGEQFDPQFAQIMVDIIDSEKHTGTEGEASWQEAITCNEYREEITGGIPVYTDTVQITFECSAIGDGNETQAIPSIIVFDSDDGRVHENPRSVRAYRYVEFGEIWFDGHSVSTGARKMVVKPTRGSSLPERDADNGGKTPKKYRIRAVRKADHLRIVMNSGNSGVDIVIAIYESSSDIYIGLTGENCRIDNIDVKRKKDELSTEPIPRIVDRIRYTDRMEADIPNVQIDAVRSAHTRGVAVKNNMRLEFHTMSLPTANLVWQCPYVLLYYDKGGAVGGSHYREYAVIKLNGEKESPDPNVKNSFSMKKTDDFPGWDEWKKTNRQGLECVVEFEKRGNKIAVVTENLGIAIRNITTLPADAPEEVYVALTGDRVALTNICIME